MSTIIVMLIVFAIMWVVEILWPANQLPQVSCWWPRVILTNVSQAGIVLLAGLTWDRWMTQLVHREGSTLRAIGSGYVSGKPRNCGRKPLSRRGRHPTFTLPHRWAALTTVAAAPPANGHHRIKLPDDCQTSPQAALDQSILPCP